MKKIAMVALAGLVVAAATVLAASDARTIRLRLTGFKEVPVISTTGQGRFFLSINEDHTELQYVLSYEKMEGTVTQAHIHLGPEQNTGAISVWLCTNLGNAPADVTVQACPAAPGEITGVIRADDVSSSATAQGVTTDELKEFLAMMSHNKTYVNVHSTKFPGGEIRSQIKRGFDEEPGPADAHDHD